MSARKTLRVGLVGAGGIARNHHVPNFRRCPKVEVVAACDVNAKALEAIKQQHGIERLCADYADLLALDSLDVVAVCTSNDKHYPVVMAAIERGLDVFCEKPLALNLAQAKEMASAAVAKGTKTGVNFSHRRTPAAQLAKEIISSGVLGDIYYVSAVYAAGWPEYAKRPGTWRNQKDKAGYGGMGDMGSHIIDMMRWWLGCDITEITARTRTFVPQRLSGETGAPMPVTTEDQGTILVSWANGAMGYICGSYTFTGRGYDQRVEVYGANGGLMYNQQHPYELEVYLPAEAVKQYHVLRQGGTTDTPYTTVLVPERLQGLVPRQPGVRRSIIMDYVDAYRADGPFVFSPGFAEGLAVQEILEATTLAERERRWVSLPL